MRYVPRRIEPTLLAAARRFPVVILTGPRRAGKTTLLRRAFPGASYHLLEDPDLVGRVRADPRGFLETARTPAILDEIQHAPELLSYVRTLVDAHPDEQGRWLLTGSQEAPLMRGVTESLAGRAAVLQLLPLSLGGDVRGVSLLRGGFPEVVARPAARAAVVPLVRADLPGARRPGGHRDPGPRHVPPVPGPASRPGCGQILNKTDLAAPLGVSVPTITEWLGILEITGQIVLVPPYFENFGKRLVKSPKLYLLDSGLACLPARDRVRARSRAIAVPGPALRGLRRLRDREAPGERRPSPRSLLLPGPAGPGGGLRGAVRGRKLLLLEAKASRTVKPEMAESLARLSGAVRGRKPESVLVFRGSEAGSSTTALRPGVRALSLADTLALIG